MKWARWIQSAIFKTIYRLGTTLESGIDVGQEITVGPGKFVKKNKRRAFNKSRASTKVTQLFNIC